MDDVASVIAGNGLDTVISVRTVDIFTINIKYGTSNNFYNGNDYSSFCPCNKGWVAKNY